MTAAQLAPGNYMVTASYGGDANYAGSSSNVQSFTITKVPSKTVLNRSPARVRFGHERAEHISVQVKGRDGGQPHGKVTVKAGSVKLCVITLRGGKGSCALTARKLHVGRYHLVASFPGSVHFAKSVSGKVTLVVTR